MEAVSEPTGMRLGTGPLPPPTIGQLLTMSDEPLIKGPGPEWPDYDPAILEEQKKKVLRERMTSHERAEFDEREREAREHEYLESIKREADEMRARFGDKADLLDELSDFRYTGFDASGFGIIELSFDGEQIERILRVAKACDCEVQCEESEPYVEFTLTPRE